MMSGRACIFCALIMIPGVASAKDTPLVARMPLVTDMKLLGDARDTVRSFRIAPSLASNDVGPGDRPTSELCEMNGPELPRVPGARMKARMSMSLDDDVDAFKPAFSLGGVGAALVRLTDALLDQ